MVLLASLVIDVEPDPRLAPVPDPKHWQGSYAAFPFMEGIRRELTALQGESASFGWMLRMDHQIHSSYGDAAYIGHRFQAEFAKLRERGDEIGLHTHLYRLRGPNDWVTDAADPEWRKRCVLEATDTFQRCFGEVCRFHSFGDRWLSDDTLDVLEAVGVRLELTPEPGMTATRSFVANMPLVGELPDYSRCPAELWRPAHADFQRVDAASGRALWLLPLSTYKLPRYFEPGRRFQRVLQRALGEPEYTDVVSQAYQRVCLTNREYVLRHGVQLLLRAAAPRTLHFAVRTDRINCARVRRRIVNNLRWLASGAAGPEIKFVSPLRLLERVQQLTAQARQVARAPAPRTPLGVRP